MSYAYFHRDGKGAWHGYDAKTNAAIEAARPLEATLTLRYPDNPEKYRTFEIRFGAKAVSRRLKSPPTSGIIQVNVADENTRVVERRAVDTGGALPAAAKDVRGPSLALPALLAPEDLPEGQQTGDWRDEEMWLSEFQS